MSARKSSVNKTKPAKGEVLIIERNARTGRFTTAKSARSIERNAKKYAAVLEQLAKK